MNISDKISILFLTCKSADILRNNKPLCVMTVFILLTESVFKFILLFAFNLI